MSEYLDLTEIKESYEKSRKGDWNTKLNPGWKLKLDVETEDCHIAFAQEEEDAAFIALAHKYVPLMIQEIERLRKLNINKAIISSMFSRS